MGKVIFTVLVLFSLNTYGQKNKSYQSSWHIEGSDELSTPETDFIYFEKGKIFYFISNDENKVVLDIRVKDEGVQNRILIEGMTVWIDMDGRQDKDMGVRFPIGSKYQSAGKSNLTTLNENGSIVTPLSMAKTIELIGFSGENSNRLPSENYDSYNGFVKYDKEGILYYRLNIPLEKIPLRNSKDGVGAVPFNLGIEYGVRGNKGGGVPPAGPPQNGSGGNAETKPPVLQWVKNISLSLKM
jgi:hypothetical protein